MRVLFALAFFAGALLAHPMGNFSVNHYSRIEVASGTSRLLYVLDFAEVPTFELLRNWGLSLHEATGSQIRQRAEEEASRWVSGLSVRQSGRPVAVRMLRVSVRTNDGAGGMAVLQVRMEANVQLSPGAVEYEDRNFAGRSGWKEIVLAESSSAGLRRATPLSVDRSNELTTFPSELAGNAPQDLSAAFEWTMKEGAPAASPEPVKLSGAGPDSVKGRAPGYLGREGYLSQLLSRQSLGWEMILIALAAAFGLGAMHALSPGHGKTIVAAYLVGSRGAPRHALFLGAMVTLTHTVSVFALGLAVLFFQQYVQPERIIPLLGALSGASILMIGGWLFFQRARKLASEGLDAPGRHHHGHGHSHSHAGGAFHSHSHDGIEHSHVLPQGNLSLGSLIVLGASGGLVPCPSALILMLSAIGMGRAGFGIGLLVAFSAGLALVLAAIGLAVIYAKDRLPGGLAMPNSPVARLVPVFSAMAVMVLGGLMTLNALGWIPRLTLAA